MLPIHIALVSETKNVSTREVNRVAAALQRQVIRDFGPIWDIRATVSAFAELEDVPIGYWPIIVMDDIQVPEAAGVHADKDGQPFALVQLSDSWSLTASHECLEMLADPFGNRLIPGQSPKKGQGRVEFLVEVSDPSEAETYAYTVNGILVSDFYTPNYFDPITAPGVRYSYTGAIKKPRQVLKGGYLSWHEPKTDHWWQLIYFDSKPKFRNLGVLGKLTGSIRSRIDSLTPLPLLTKGLSKKSKTLLAVQATDANIQEKTDSKAKIWRQQIKELIKGGK